MTKTTASAIENIEKNQTIVLQTTTGEHIFQAKPLFKFLHQYFPDTSFEVLEILLSKNAVFALHIAKQHHLLPVTNIPSQMRLPDTP